MSLETTVIKNRSNECDVTRYLHLVVRSPSRRYRVALITACRFYVFNYRRRIAQTNPDIDKCSSFSLKLLLAIYVVVNKTRVSKYWISSITYYRRYLLDRDNR